MSAEVAEAKVSIGPCLVRAVQAFGDYAFPFVLLNGAYFALTQAADWGSHMLPEGRLSTALSAFDMLMAITYSAFWIAISYVAAAGQPLDRRVLRMTAFIFPAIFRICLLFMAVLLPLMFGVIAVLSIIAGSHAVDTYGSQVATLTVTLLIVALAPLQLSAWLLLEPGMKVRSALWASWKLSRGNRARLVLLTLPLAFYLLLNLMPEGNLWKPLSDAFGDIVVYPFAQVTLAYAFLQLRPPEPIPTPIAS